MYLKLTFDQVKIYINLSTFELLTQTVSFKFKIFIPYMYFRIFSVPRAMLHELSKGIRWDSFLN